MGSELIDSIIKQAPVAALAIIGAWILWKRYDQYMAITQKHLEEAEARIQRYIDDDRVKLEDLVRSNTEAFKEMAKTNERCNKIMDCLIHEIKEFKTSPPYLERQKTKQ